MSSGCMQGESEPLIYWVPAALVGIGLCLWILWHLLIRWPAAWGQPLPPLGLVFGGAAGLLLVGLVTMTIKGTLSGPTREKRS